MLYYVWSGFALLNLAGSRGVPNGAGKDATCLPHVCGATG